MEHEFKGGPWLGGWTLAAVIGAVALGLCLAVGQFDMMPAMAISAVMFLLVGLMLTWLAGQPAPVVNRVAASPAPDATVIPMAKAADMMAEPALAAAAPTTSKKAAPAAKSAAAAKPVLAAVPSVGPKKPKVLKAPRKGVADDLKIIKGVGPKLEILCHGLGFYHFDQIAAWTDDEISWVDQNLEGFKGRVSRDRWVPQARAVIDMGAPAFLEALDSGKEF